MSAFSCYIFVDFENVQDVDLTLAKDRPVHVTLLIGAKQTKLDTKLATQMHALAMQAEPIEVGESGRNALDLTLAVYLGRKIEQHRNAKFVIVSQDHDFDPMIAHLQKSDTQIERVHSFASVSVFASAPKTARSVKASKTPIANPQRSSPRTPPAKLAPTAESPATTKTPANSAPTRSEHSAIPNLTQRQETILRKLADPGNKNRPSTEKALLAHLKTSLGKYPTEDAVTATLSLLIERGVLTINAQKRVDYRHR